MPEELKGAQDIYTGNSEMNALSFMIRMILTNEVNTAVPVKVLSATDEQRGGAVVQRQGA